MFNKKIKDLIVKMLNAIFITRQLSFFSERIRGVKQWQASNLSRVATQWHGRELNPQPSSYKAELFPLSHGALSVLYSISEMQFHDVAFQPFGCRW